MEFWQRLLAAETQLTKAQALSEILVRDPNPVGALLSSPLLTASERKRARAAPVDVLTKLVAEGVRLLRKDDLPEHYSQIPSSALALFCWGDPSCLSQPAVAIVGTRAATNYGKAAAQKFAEELASAGVTIVSGGALGIDAAAHKGALAVGGKTAAVLITGIEHVYPRVHFGLFQQIKSQGCLLSQFPVGMTNPREYRPLQRNHTVAALANALIVIEAPETSGALSTAASANEMGRQVFVVPANIDNVNFRGSHALIRDGAALVDHPDQVLDALGLTPASGRASSVDLTPIQQKIMGVLSSTPLACEFIVEKTKLDTSAVLSELTVLEIEGHVTRVSGGFATRL